MHPTIRRSVLYIGRSLQNAILRAGLNPDDVGLKDECLWIFSPVPRTLDQRINDARNPDRPTRDLADPSETRYMHENPELLSRMVLQAAAQVFACLELRQKNYFIKPRPGSRLPIHQASDPYNTDNRPTIKSKYMP